MERLTTSNKGGPAFTFDLDITCDRSEIEKIIKLGEKLKQYEDTGLTPEEIMNLIKNEDYWHKEAIRLAAELGELKIGLQQLIVKYGPKGVEENQ